MWRDELPHLYHRNRTDLPAMIPNHNLKNREYRKNSKTRNTLNNYHNFPTKWNSLNDNTIVHPNDGDVIVLLLYVHGTQLWSYWAGQLFWVGLDLLSG